MPLFIFNAVDGQILGWLSLRFRPGLARKSLQRLGVVGQIFRDTLPGDVPPQLQSSPHKQRHTPRPRAAEDT